MAMLKSISGIMGQPAAYRAWQAPFAEAKLAPLFRHNDLSQVRRVLDVGCGPGINTRHFAHTQYRGLDINPLYIEYAKQRYQRDFITADVCTYCAPEDEKYDFILLNSLLHHIDDENTLRLLRQLHRLLSPDGHVHILDLVLPEHASVSRFLARSDRGDYPRPLDEWRRIFGEVFGTVLFEPYPLGLCGVTLWNMVYFKGKANA
jgi:SAM-dependent methyltransferase